MKYTLSQQQAIDAIDCNVHIIACAGSGKTQVISERIINLLTQGVEPAHVVAFTFTEKAAGELKARIYQLSMEIRGTDAGLAAMFIGTIHSYCNMLLHSPPVYSFLKYEGLSEVQQKLFIDHYSKQSGLTSLRFNPSGEPLKRWQHSSIYQNVLSVLGEASVDRSKVPAAILQAESCYHQLRNGKRYLDHTTQVSEALAQIQTNTYLRDHLASTLKYLVVDEYQDINPLQEKLIEELYRLGANLCVVGDDDQMIYAWRGSDVDNIISFASRYPNVKRISLNDNFRSSPGIVHTARHVIEKNSPRLPKRMESMQAQCYERGDLLALDFADPHEEAVWIAGKIQALYATSYCDTQDSPPRGLSYADFAVLLRSVRKDGAPIRAAFDAAGIPYVLVGMNSLFETKEIDAMCRAFFYLSPPWSDKLVTAADVKQALVSAPLGLSPAQIDKGVDYLEGIKDQVRQYQQRYDELSLQSVYLKFLEHLELREEAQTNQQEKRQKTQEIVYYNLGKFSQVISDFETINFRNAPNDKYPAFSIFFLPNKKNGAIIQREEMMQDMSFQTLFKS